MDFVRAFAKSSTKKDDVQERNHDIRGSLDSLFGRKQSHTVPVFAVKCLAKLYLPLNRHNRSQKLLSMRALRHRLSMRISGPRGYNHTHLHPPSSFSAANPLLRLCGSHISPHNGVVLFRAFLTSLE